MQPSEIMKSGSGRVLSIYMDVDQSAGANRNREFEPRLNAEVAAIESRLEEASELSELRAAARVARDFVSSYQPLARSLVLFARANGEVFARNLQVQVPAGVRWLDHPYVQPLEEVLDEFEEILVAFVDSRGARLLSNAMGQTVEHASIEMRSDDSIDEFLEDIAKALESLAAAHPARSIMLAGNHSLNTQLFLLLSDDSRKRVAGFLSMPESIRESTLNDAILTARERAERTAEVQKVAALFSQAGSDSAVVGPQATLDALNSGRIRELVYAEGASVLGMQCDNCNLLYLDNALCPHCQCAGRPIEELSERVVATAVEKGAAIEEVKGAAADTLRAVGAMGAFLK